MRINQKETLRWFFAELLVIVLGISIAFQVEQWRQHLEDKEMETRALQEVLGDLDAMELSVSEAISIYDVSTDRAIKLFQLIQSGSPDESKYLENLSLSVYLLGESENQYAYEGLLDAGRFANVENPELTDSMRKLFTLRKPWIFSLNVRHIERWDDLMNEMNQDLKRVPDNDFSVTGKSHRVMSVPLDEFPTSPGVMSDLLAFIDSSKSMVEKFRLILQDIDNVRLEIIDYLKNQSSA